MNKRIYLSSPDIGELEKKYINEAFETNWVAPLGPHVDKFETEMAEYVQRKGALALSSGTAAIHLALKLLGVSQGDSVICSSLTFAASCNPILYEKGEPVFIDSEPDTWNMSSRALERALEECKKENNLPKAAVIVDLYGQSADMDPLLEICSSYGVPVVEDAAEALGAEYKGRKCGSFGDYSVLSFNGNKIITTSGGGMLLSDNLESLDKARFWATQARDKALHYQHSELGYNYRMSNICAAIGRGQLTGIEEKIQKRRRVFDKYREAFGGINGINFMPEPQDYFSNRWLTVLTIDKELFSKPISEIILKLEEKNIEARPVWKPMHQQPLFSGYRYFPHQVDESVSDKFFERGICLPSGSNLTVEEQETVINSVRNILGLSD